MYSSFTRSNGCKHWRKTYGYRVSIMHGLKDSRNSEGGKEAMGKTVQMHEKSIEEYASEDAVPCGAPFPNSETI